MKIQQDNTVELEETWNHEIFSFKGKAPSCQIAMLVTGCSYTHENVLKVSGSGSSSAGFNFIYTALVIHWNTVCKSF